MFATWKYDRDTSEVQNIRLAYDPISARSSQHQACDRCHEKKVSIPPQRSGVVVCLKFCAGWRPATAGRWQLPNTTRTLLMTRLRLPQLPSGQDDKILTFLPLSS